MVVQYPHTLIATTTIQPTGQDQNGDWTPGEFIESDPIECRAESATGNGYIAGADGTRIDYSWIVYMPLSTDILQTGTSVTIKDGENIICTDTIKRFSKGQMNCRAWL
jgi:hypothetical protein